MFKIERIKPCQKRSAAIAVGAIAILGGIKVFEGDTESPSLAPPAVYDITRIGCDYPSSLRTAQRAIDLRKPLVAQVARPNTEAVNSWLQAYDHEGFQVVNPLLISCKGTLTHVMGVDRGFYGDGRAKVVAAPIRDLEFSEDVFEPKSHQYSIPASKIGRYVNIDTIIDKGSAPGKVAGLTSVTFGSATTYGLMP